MPVAGLPQPGAVGRQPVIDYLTKDYAGFRQAMLDQIPQRLPNWTDRSEADFGVVLIELFAYVADILSYYQDRVANESFLSTATQRRSVAELLRLIGYQIDPGLSASTLIHCHVETLDTAVVVSGPALPFKVKTSGRQGEPEIVFEVTREFTLHPRNNSIRLSAVDTLEASATAIRLSPADHDLSVGDRVYFEQTRSPGRDATRDPGPVRSPQLTIVGVTPLEDGTEKISWLPPLPQAFDPALTTLKGNNVIATHGVTIEDESKTAGTDESSQRVTLSRGPVSHVLRSGDSRRRRSSPELEVRVGGVLWQEVDSFFDSGPADTHYVTTVDENDRLTITFGTGARGQIVPKGIVIESRYRIGIGAGGNVGPGTLTTPVTTVAGITAVTNPFPATGGADRESTEEARISGPGSIIAQERAVTLEDYRLLAQGFPGVAKARARVGLRGGYKVVQVFVAPETTVGGVPQPPSAELKVALKRHLEARMPVNRMAGVDVLDPIYVPVDITLDVHLQPAARREQVRELVRQTLAELFSFARLSMGQPIRIGEVFSALFPLPGVAFVQVKRLARRDGPVSTSECALSDVAIAEHELAIEGELTVNSVGGR